MLVFVYGTLRAGEANHHWLEGSICLGPHTTKPRYTLLDLGDYPAAIESGHAAIHGEVYRVTPEIMAKLDLLEDFPLEYTRKHIPTAYGQAWMYFWNRPRTGQSVIASGDWLARLER